MIPDWLNIYVLLKFLEQGLPAKDERSLYIATYAIKLLHYMVRDRWFKRTWILQEKQCAASLFLFVPIPPDIELPDEESLKEKFRPPLVGNDLCIELASIQRLWASRDLFADFYNEEFSVEKGYRDGFQGLWVMAPARYCSTKYMDEERLAVTVMVG
jgi:hypothetical protein